MNSAQLLASAIRFSVEQWMQTTTVDERVAAFDDTAALSEELGSHVKKSLEALGAQLDVIRQNALGTAFTHLENVFQPGELPDTPQKFLYVPEAEGTLAGRASALAAHAFLGLETVSYGSENDGELFVNLVPMPGEGRIAEKSKAKMRGHTDAVSFPFRGETDPSNPRIAPSPDVVTLVGMRNPDAVGTTVMPLEDILSHLSPDVISELKKAQFAIRTQQTFQQGILDELGKAHTLLDAALLSDIADTTQVRFSHRNVVAPEEHPRGEHATERFKEACELAVQAVVVRPGDVLLVSNRICLHGRGVVGETVGGRARWLLRTYALNTTGMDEGRRHLNERPTHVLYP